MITTLEAVPETVSITRDILMPPDDLRVEDWRHYEGLKVVLCCLSETGPDIDLHGVPQLSGDCGSGVSMVLEGYAVTRIVMIDSHGEALQVTHLFEMTKEEQSGWENAAISLIGHHDSLRENIEGDRIGVFI